MNTPTLALRSHALALDDADPLKAIRHEFLRPRRADGSDVAYLCGHSLGLEPRRAVTYVNEELEEWQRLAVEGHFNGRRPWLSYHERLTPPLARLAGALPLEVVAMNSLTVNLHLLLVSFYRPAGNRRKLLIERPAFPSDRYAAVSQILAHGLDPADALLEIGPREGEDRIREEDVMLLLDREGEAIATVLLPGVQYLTGQRFDMQAITRAAQAKGCVVGFDLAHAIGNVPLSLHDWNVDFAVWCSYKYLNGGPGAIGGAFVHERHSRDETLPRFAGWWGHDKETRFRMGPDFQALPGAEGWQLSNPPILAMAPLLASLEIFDAAGNERRATKATQLTGYLEVLLREKLGQRLDILTPAARGSQVSFRVRAPSAVLKSLHGGLQTRGFYTDLREPDVLRATPVPLYNSYIEAWEFVAGLEALLTA